MSDQGFVWPPSESELDSYILPLSDPGLKPAQTPVSDSSAAWQTDAGQSAEAESSPDESPKAGLVPLLLSDVLHSHVTFHWHEAVAIVRQLADQLTHGFSLEPQGSIPGVDGIELEPAGRLRARLDPVGTVPVVRGLGYLLDILLADTDAPARLRLIVSQAVSEAPTFPSVERLTWELAGFERPRRLETLKQLYDRTTVVRRARLLVPAASGPDIHPSPAVSSRTVAHATEEADEGTVRRPQLSWPAFTLALLAGAVGGALLFAAVIARSPGREAAPSTRAAESTTRDFKAASTTRIITAESTTRDLGSGVQHSSQKQTDEAPADPVRRAGRIDISSSRARGRPQNDEAVSPPMNSAAAASRTAPPPISGPARLGPAGEQRSSPREVPQRVQREYRRARALFDQQDYAKASDGFQQVVKLLDDGELMAPMAELRLMASDFSVLSRAKLSAMSEGRVYRSGDQGVTEPVALRVYLPDPAPETPPSRLGALLLVVNGEGAVESVRLQSPSNRYHDRFWVSAAKTWHFKPALKDGQPVKFLKRIVITEPPLSDPR